MLMYRIAICDDEKSTCAEIESYILMYSKLRFIRNEIEVFYSGEAFCEYVKQGNFFDLLFLDIELPAINGIEVGMESILSKFPKEKDVSVGENGNKLSGGQKQRIAMARALVHADNVLILDEATSALDNITQNEIMKNIKPLYQDKIVIIITHRLDTISDVDKIFVMSEGRICEEGQHNELMKKGEKYYALVQNL